MYKLIFVLLTTLIFSVVSTNNSHAGFTTNNYGQIMWKSDKPEKKVVKKYKKKAYKKSSRKGTKGKRKSSGGSVPKSGFTTWKGHKMPKSVAVKLMAVENMFGRITIISSCRPGATVKKSGRPSMHRYCRAIDFHPPKGTYSKVASYLKSTWKGGVGTYSGRFNHIHIDDNRGRWHN